MDKWYWTLESDKGDAEDSREMGLTFDSPKEAWDCLVDVATETWEQKVADAEWKDVELETFDEEMKLVITEKNGTKWVWKVEEV